MTESEIQLDYQQSLLERLHKLRQQLDMETAILSYINNGKYVIVVVDSSMEGVFQSGMTFPIADTYCNAVFENNDLVVYPHVGGIETMLQHPVYQAVKLESYIGYPIRNHGGAVVGTVNLTSLEPKTDVFTQQTVEQVKVFAASLSNAPQSYLDLAKKVAS